MARKKKAKVVSTNPKEGKVTFEIRDDPPADAAPLHSAANNTINNVARMCRAVENGTAEELRAAQKSLVLDVKFLRQQRKDLREALAYNQAKLARINKTILITGLKLEGEKVYEDMEEILEGEE